MKSSSSGRWFCAQIGRRQHYAVPRTLHRTGQLAMLYTDFWAGTITRKLTRTSILRALSSRFHQELAHISVRSYNLRSLAWEAGLRLRQKSINDESLYLGFCEIGRQFATAVRQDLKQRRDLSPETIFFAYDTGALEIFEHLRKIGAFCIIDQMDPSRVEVELVREEEKRWPGWQMYPSTVPEVYFQRREQEWALADRVLVNSEFSKSALIQQGVPEEKLVEIPLYFEADEAARELAREKRRAESSGEISYRRPLKVLFLGQIILRKGIQYLMEVARLMRNEAVHFDIVGPIGISDDAVKSAPPNMTFHGRASGNRASAWYLQSDVFVLPTLSDGFAITQIEAMAHGLPVITTPNCGRVVTDGVNGLIVPVRDVEALAHAIARYIESRELLLTHQEAARRKAGDFNLSRLSDNLAVLQAKLYNRTAVSN